MRDARWLPATCGRPPALVEQAKLLKVGYGFHDDSPGKVEALIAKYKEMSDQDGGRPTTDAARRRRTEVLMEEGEQLLRWGECDEAERLASDAAALRVPYGPFDASPRTLLERIAVERKKRQGTVRAELGRRRR